MQRRKMLGVVAISLMAVAAVNVGAADGRETAAGKLTDRHLHSHPLPAGKAAKAPKELVSAVAAAEVAANPPVCEGDGSTGKRVAVLYVRESSQPDRYAKYLHTIRAYMAAVDDAYNDSAAQTGGSRHIRFVTKPYNSSCVISVANVVVPNGTFRDGKIFSAVSALGYKRTDRNYMVFSENTLTCGGATGDTDSRPGSENRFNTGPHYAEVAAPCWGANAAGHELGHMLGAVLDGAPYSDGGGHCTQEWDLMCQSPTSTTHYQCLDKDSDRLMDCRHDTYFSTNPTAGSWLASHWNVANNQFLIKRSVPDATGLGGGKTYVITNKSTGEAIDGRDSSTGALAELSARARTDGTSQKWVLNYETGFQLANANSQLCADAAYSGTAPGTRVLQYGCNGQQGMRWAFRPLGDGTYAIVNYLNGLTLTRSAAYPAALTLQEWTGYSNQRWVFNQVADPGPQTGSTYRLTSVRNVHNAAPVGGATTPGTDITHAVASNSTDQQWRLVKTAAGTWIITNAASTLCLSPETTAAPGVRLEQALCDGSANQTWKLVRSADTRYGIWHAPSGLAVTLIDYVDAALQLQRYYGGGSTNRIWGLRPVG
ncbi:MAG: RICIN domain-containing protein [Micromonosporaceae bacterium]